jgi:hypothetical protein
MWGVAIALTIKIEATRSRRPGENMVSVFFEGVLLVVGMLCLSDGQNYLDTWLWCHWPDWDSSISTCVGFCIQKRFQKLVVMHLKKS